jgi:hypothetical protein
MSSCKLFETLSKCNATLIDKYNITSYKCDESCPHFNKCFYKVECPPEDSKLQEYFGGWQKYALYDMTSVKDCKFSDASYIILNILHLITPFKPNDIIIFRIAKKNKEDDGYSIRYICKQGNKSTITANIKQLNEYMVSKCEYIGRNITPLDFKFKSEG